LPSCHVPRPKSTATPTPAPSSNSPTPFAQPPSAPLN
jgi:hypothetical protein